MGRGREASSSTVVAIPLSPVDQEIVKSTNSFSVSVSIPTMNVFALLLALFLTAATSSTSAPFSASAAKTNNDGASGVLDDGSNTITMKQQLEPIVSKAAAHHGMHLSTEQLDRLVMAVQENLQQQEEPSFDADDDVPGQQRRELAFANIFDLFQQLIDLDGSGDGGGGGGGGGLDEIFDAIGDWFDDVIQDLEVDHKDAPYTFPGTNSMCHDAACKKKKKTKQPGRGKKRGRGPHRRRRRRHLMADKQNGVRSRRRAAQGATNRGKKTPLRV